MQSRVNELLQRFTSKENAMYLFQLLSKDSPPVVTSYLKEYFMESLQRYSRTAWQDYTYSSPLPGVTISDELHVLNKAFLRYQIEQIKTHVLVEEAPAYVVSDGMPTSRRGINHHTMKADDILETWKSNSGRGVQSREDTQSKYLSNDDNLMETGIMFCDQSKLGVNRHHEALLNNSYIKALNENQQSHTYASIGNADRSNDDRLLSRRIFRSSEDGVENGIPRYERRLYKRNIDRDITENLRGDSHGFKQRGYDMTDLRNRVDEKRMRYQQPAKSTLNLQYHKFNDNERYC